jgi:hypothetical protein
VSTANRRLFPEGVDGIEVITRPTLHLRTSNRSLRAEGLADWVNLVLAGDAEGAAALKIAEKFPISVSRSLTETRSKLSETGLGPNRYGLAASSGAARLRAEGLEPSSSFHADYPWEHWYLAERTDIRSSYQCEVFATEFEIQGLELDWVGLCWGGDMIWDPASAEWRLRGLRHGANPKWSEIKSPAKRMYRRNAYRVLLTRARQGMILFVPEGNAHDPTLSTLEFDATAAYLNQCGASVLRALGSGEQGSRLW